VSPEERETRTKINYWDFIKIKSFRTAKETINKTKRQLRNGKRYLQITLSDKCLISKIHKEFILLNSKTKQTNKKPKIQLLKNGQKLRIDIFPKKTYRWPADT